MLVILLCCPPRATSTSTLHQSKYVLGTCIQIGMHAVVFKRVITRVGVHHKRMPARIHKRVYLHGIQPLWFQNPQMRLVWVLADRASLKAEGYVETLLQLFLSQTSDLVIVDVYPEDAVGNGFRQHCLRLRRKLSPGFLSLGSCKCNIVVGCGWEFQVRKRQAE